MAQNIQGQSFGLRCREGDILFRGLGLGLRAWIWLGSGLGLGPGAWILGAGFRIYGPGSVA